MNETRTDTKGREKGLSLPAVSLPKGGGAIRGIGEKFAANPVTGTGSMSVPIATSPGRSGFGPQLALSYDSGAGNGPFGFGWTLSLPAITRKTEKGLPRYRDAEESDVFVLSGAEDLVPVVTTARPQDGVVYRVRLYRPRIEGLFARIEQWVDLDSGAIHWRSITRDNITTLYGKDARFRIADPADPTRIFSWLICESFDDRGNAIAYEYKAENSEGVDRSQAHERNRTASSRSANRYLKRIQYGNRVSRLIQPDLSQVDWMFEVVFDYGEHAADDPRPAETSPWLCRQDAFSSYRAGFEVRTYRLCQRVLMFHHFPQEQDVGRDCLVRSTDFSYRAHPVASFITSVVQRGYKRQAAGGYLKKCLPPLEFEYSQAVIDEEIRELDAESLKNLPYGLDGTKYQWIDLDGEGVSGVLTEQAGAWFYKPNLGEGQLGPIERIPLAPSLADLSSGRQQLLDLAGDGQLDLVELDGPTPGFFERTRDSGWERFAPFSSLPNIAWHDPNLRFVDLDGDGHADVLITEDEAFAWYPSLAEAGFGAVRHVPKQLDEEKGPRLVLADGTQSVYLADMCGDGLTDLVRIRNGEVCYWPNLGHGRFGAKVTMDDAPWFDLPDQFEQRRMRLADIDGSGNNDIIYLGRDGVRLYFNQSGNRWSEARRLSQFPRVDNLSSVTAADLLGNGTACLAWSSPLPADVRRPVRYIDLMGGQKPHLLVSVKNNLGAETRVRYAPSTRFYLADKAAGRPWITRLPFPVHVVERVETYDRISRNRFVTRYAYRHGYFDGVEREFRGFGFVEQWDTEEFAALGAGGEFPPGDNIDATSHVPPVLTKTWFHTGAFQEDERISRLFEPEYYHEPGLSDDLFRAQLLPDTVLPPDLTAEEAREACRALKGSILRLEVYGLDGSAKSAHPFSVSERNYTVKRLQPRAGNRHAVFFAHSRETIDYHYERNPADPRIGHAATLAVDDFGNALTSAAVGYGRRQPDPALPAPDQAKQAQRFVTYTENAFTNPIEENDAYRAPLPSEARTYELTGADLPAGHRRFSFDELLQIGSNASSIAYEQAPAAGVLQKRLIEHVRTLYRRNDLAGPLPLGQLQSLAFPFEGYKCAFTPGLVGQVYGARVTGAMLESEARYVHSEGDANWWIPSGQIFYSPSGTDSAAQELAFARQHFFLPRRFRDPFGQTATVTYDAYDFLVDETRDALGNRVTVGERNAAGAVTVRGNDYRVLQPRAVMDPNRNRSLAAFDALGMVVGTAAMGKPEERLGDSLDGFIADLADAAIAAYLQDPLADPHAILQRATTRFVYDLFAFSRSQGDAQPKPAVAAALVRETHDADLGAGQKTRIQHALSYSDGFGREMQKKIQAEPGPLAEGGTDISPRWVGSGWTIFNNKGKPVRQYEPFFSAAHGFEFARIAGVSPILFYDPAERVVATLHPDHTYEKVVFDPWRQSAWDVNDTVLVADPKDDADVGDYFRRLPDAEYLPTWYAQRQGGAKGADERAAALKAAVHAGTATVAVFDPLGRTFLTVAHNRFERNGAPVEERYATRIQLDIEGNQRAVTDALDRAVMRYDYDMLGNRIHQASMEAGERWMLNDVTGKALYAWDSRAHMFRTLYDALRRPTDVQMREGAGPVLVVQRTVYGETQASPEAANLRGKVFQVFDAAGAIVTSAYDFKGNALRTSRQLAAEYKRTLDWSGSVPLEQQTYTSRTTYDALNRPLTLTLPDDSVVTPSYNEANLLERMAVSLGGDQTATPFVTNIDYDAKGQRTQIEYGNGVRTRYEYDAQTFRLVRLLTRRGAAFPDDCPNPATVPCGVQNLRYTYDPAGNITSIRDDAQQTVYFRNRRVEPSAEYTYDAIYRLIDATGREHLGQSARGDIQPPTPTSPTDAPRVDLLHPGDGNAMGRYAEQYQYDPVGNILELLHRGTDPAHPGWTRAYTYTEASLLEPGKISNRLTSTRVGGGIVEPYTHDVHGNMTAMPHLPLMRWDERDQLQASAQQTVQRGGTPETTYYVYDGGGQRVRKVTERQATARQTPTRKAERIYLGGFEIYREYGGDGNAVTLERETLHVMDDKQRIALVETRTKGSDGSPAQLVRYQLGNHLGSASLELDAAAQVISYEEYYPYGSTSYQAVNKEMKAAAKRYRYTGKERDEENGLYYHGVRYYAPWLGRWTSCDPAGPVDGPNLYRFVRNDPIRLFDPDGKQSAAERTLLRASGGAWGALENFGGFLKLGLYDTWAQTFSGSSKQNVNAAGEWFQGLYGAIDEDRFLAWVGEGLEQRGAAIEDAEARGEHFESGKIFGDTAMNAYMIGRGGFDALRGGIRLAGDVRAYGSFNALKGQAYGIRYWATTYEGLGVRSLPSVRSNVARGSPYENYTTYRAMRTVARETATAERVIKKGGGSHQAAVQFYRRSIGTRVERAAYGTAVNRLVDETVTQMPDLNVATQQPLGTNAKGRPIFPDYQLTVDGQTSVIDITTPAQAGKALKYPAATVVEPLTGTSMTPVSPPVTAPTVLTGPLQRDRENQSVQR